MTQVKTIATAEPSVSPPPMVRHIVDKGDVPSDVPSAETVARFKLPTQGTTTPQQRTLCGEPWDRLHITPGPLCDPCKAEYRRRHPTWPFPGGAS